MKRFPLIFMLIITLINVSNAQDSAPQKMLIDGYYYADVAYYNYATYTSADYNLKVKVKDGVVIVIYLNNGGVVHYGINNEDYLYTGGKLEINKDKKTGELQYSSQVSISNGRSISTYSISILKEAPDDKQ
ncbi:MAG: hypothetical protein ACXVB0_10855 [Mucilaginibacter sp.]